MWSEKGTQQRKNVKIIILRYVSNFKSWNRHFTAILTFKENPKRTVKNNATIFLEVMGNGKRQNWRILSLLDFVKRYEIFIRIMFFWGVINNVTQWLCILWNKLQIQHVCVCVCDRMWNGFEKWLFD